ncbi:MAG: hypothetical protein R2690_13175 [Acidimicrobiales bacterium]
MPSGCAPPAVGTSWSPPPPWPPRADPTTSAVSGDRAPRRAAPLADLLRHLAALQSPVTVRAAGNATPVTGTLRSVGADVVTLSCDGRTVVVPLANVDEVAVDELVL